MKDNLYKAICERIKNYCEENADLNQEEKNGVRKVVPTILDMMTDLNSIYVVAKYFDFTKSEIEELENAVS